MGEAPATRPPPEGHSAGDGRAVPDISAARVQAAADRLRPWVLATPLEHSPFLSEAAGVPVHLKLECFQRTRSFKARGAFNALLASNDGGAPVVAASAGNHGLGVALAARELGRRALLFVPATAPDTKLRRIRELGARLRLVEGTYDDAEAAARAASVAGEGVFVHAFEDPEVVAGQGTLGLEIAASAPDVAQVVVPVGGGGLLAGVGAALAGMAPEARVLGVQSELTRAMHDAFAAGRPVATRVVPTLADGLAGGVSEVSYARARAVAASVELVPEREVAPAIRALYHHHGVVAEGSAAVAAAALLAGAVVPSGPTVVVITGGNLDGGRLAEILS